MFAIIISEKGGAERRELFDKQEIHVGRMQGNDLMLPKGNVSKRHARLIFRDGRVIVTDLKSTNGTYVNGRKIAQGTVVSEGDRIYVGDFVLRVELTPVSSSASNETRSGLEMVATASQGDEAPPFRATMNSEVEFTSPQPVFIMPARATSETVTTPPPASTADSPGQTLPPGRFSPAPAAASDSMLQRRAARVGALRVLLEALGSAVDSTHLAGGADAEPAAADKLREDLRENAQRLREQNALGAEIDLEEIVGDAMRELFGLGPVDLLLDDQDVSEIRVLGADQVTATKNGRATVSGPSFSSEAAIVRAVLRLCRRSGQPWQNGETVVDRRLANGLVVHAVLQPVSESGPALIVKRPRVVQVTLEDLVGAGMLSAPMAALLGRCVALRSNLLLVGPADVTALLQSALVADGNGHGRAILLRGADETWAFDPSPLVIPLRDVGPAGAQLVRAAVKLNPERLLVQPLVGHVGAATLDAIARGARGVVASVPAPSLRHALSRLIADVMMALPGTTTQAARAHVCGPFELAVEMARLRDGRLRVTRVSELGAADGETTARDIFNFVADRRAAAGVVDGSFVATGVVPRMVDEQSLQGATFDSAAFRR
jgi:pilus assembly protein CpaF